MRFDLQKSVRENQIVECERSLLEEKVVNIYLITKKLGAQCKQMADTEVLWTELNPSGVEFFVRKRSRGGL